MKWLIINTEAFSAKCVDGKGQPRLATPNDLPMLVKHPFIVLDESSKIKSNVALKEIDKSQRCQIIKQLEPFGERCIMTGTLQTKSPINVIDQYDFLKKGYIPESVYEFAEHYCVMITIRVGRGRRVLISSKDYDAIRNRMKNAYIRGGELQLERTQESIFKEYTIDYKKLEHILVHKKYTPFIRQDELIKRLRPVSMFVKREDVFDIKNDYFVTHPIMRRVELSDKAKRIANELIELGFSDNITLGKTPALELQHRIQDICNGFEPMKDEETGVVSYRPFKDNPKLDDLMELLEEIGAPYTQVVVWSSRVNFLDAVKKRLDAEDIPCVVYSGSESKEEKEKAERLFESKEAAVFLANQASAAYGLNCLRNASYEVFTCIDGSVERLHQASFRILRGKVTSPKFAYHLCVKGSIEERMIRCIEAGTELINETNDKEKFRFE